MQPVDATVIPAGLQSTIVGLPNGMDLHVVERPGSGVPVLCLHGIWDWWRYWVPLLPEGAGSFGSRPLHMVDLRGHGASGKPETGYRLRDYAADIVALIEAQGWEQVTLVGHSLGAAVSLLVVAQLPSRVDALVLEDPPVPLQAGPSEMFRGVYEMRAQRFEQVVDDFQVWRPWLTLEQAREVATCLTQTADGVFQASFSGLSDGTVVPVPGVALPQPTLVLQAGNVEQRALRAGGIELLEAALPNLTLVTIGETSHTVLRDDPAAWRAAVAAAGMG